MADDTMRSTNPVATNHRMKVTISPQWCLEDREYPPNVAWYKPLINGEEAFREVYEAIEQAIQTVDIVCWGFQPSMYFIRDRSQSLMIGELLEKKACEGVKVRILGWEAPFNITGYFVEEANLPGKQIFHESISRTRRGQTSTDAQFEYDKKFFRNYALTDKFANDYADDLGDAGIATAFMYGASRLIGSKDSNLIFISRGFDRPVREYIRHAHYEDKGVSNGQKRTMALSPSHHQKTVLVDYADPNKAIGFVMGHNMLDAYWDTDEHSAANRNFGVDMPAPHQGPRGLKPRQDISSKVVGPLLKYVNDNFTRSWLDETGQNLDIERGIAKDYAPSLWSDYFNNATKVPGQIVRTQPEYRRNDILLLYKTMVKNTTSFIFIENQYFRWPPFAEWLKQRAQEQKQGSGPEIYLFVLTNKSDEGIGSGVRNTLRMMRGLGRQDVMPNLMKLDRVDEVFPSFFGSKSEQTISDEIKEIKEEPIKIDSYPGLHVLIGSLVAPDSLPSRKDPNKQGRLLNKKNWMESEYSREWMDVYIHSKLMMIDDVFTTHGSANVNTRSMQVDSEINITHHDADTTKAMRRRLWQMHTQPSPSVKHDDSMQTFFQMANQEDENGKIVAAKAFKGWQRIMERNKLFKEQEFSPCASLIEFEYNGIKLSDSD